VPRLFAKCRTYDPKRKQKKQDHVFCTTDFVPIEILATNGQNGLMPTEGPPIRVGNQNSRLNIDDELGELGEVAGASAVVGHFNCDPGLPASQSSLSAMSFRAFCFLVSFARSAVEARYLLFQALINVFRALPIAFGLFGLR
jgi:hypothetical protein